MSLEEPERSECGVFYLVGLGLASEFDLSLGALNVLGKCDFVYLESYTGVYDRVNALEELVGKTVNALSRLEVEGAGEFISQAKGSNVALLVQGDPLSATTHVSLLLECVKRGVKFEVIHASSVFTAVARTGLSLYKFGKTASIPFPAKGYAPSSFYDVLLENLSINAHTLFLLDVRSDAHDYLSIPEALKILESVDKKGLLKGVKLVGCARLGYSDELINYGAVSTLKKVKWGKPPYCLIYPCKSLHFVEEDALKVFGD